VIGHCGDTGDLDYLRTLMDAGSTIGMDRFGLTWFRADEDRTKTVADLCRLGYADRMTLSHDAGYFSVNTEPSYRSKALPAWKHTLLSDVIIPNLRDLGVTDAHLNQMMVVNLSVPSGRLTEFRPKRGDNHERSPRHRASVRAGR
jgi:phosphotriesterase-related protein